MTAVVTMSWASAPHTNLVVNPGFEEGDFARDAEPFGWDVTIFGSARMTWDGTQAHGGGRSAKISSFDGVDANWYQTLPVRPDTRYRFSAWVKTEDVACSPEGVSAGSNLSRLGTWNRSRGLFGTNDWTRVSMLFNSGDASDVTVALRLGYWLGLCTGTVWFDDVEVAPFSYSGADVYPRWKILVLIYRETEIRYIDDDGVIHHLTGALTDDGLRRATEASTLFVTRDIPLLTSSAMVPELTIRYPERALAPSRIGNAWRPLPWDTTAERDPAFDSVIVIWQPWVTDRMSGRLRFIGAGAGMASWMGNDQLYASLIAPHALGDPHRNVYRHEWGHSLLFYFEAVGLAPLPTVDVHASAGDYVHCPSGKPYVWEAETLDSVIPNSIYNVHSGFTHDYYSGTVASPGQPTRCLGITTLAWAFGGPVTNILSQPSASQRPSHTALVLTAGREKLNVWVPDGGSALRGGVFLVALPGVVNIPVDTRGRPLKRGRWVVSGANVRHCRL
jgi:hypothetical protein